jgi:hypothetical protein
MGMLMLVMMFMVMLVMMFVVMLVVMLVMMFMVMLVVVMMFMVMLVVVMMFMAILFDAIDSHSEVRSDNSAFRHALNGDADVWNANGIDCAEKTLLVINQFIQSGCKHIACRAHSAVQI